MAGREQFSQVVAQASREQIVVINTGATTNVAASATEIIDLYSPVNTRDEVVNMYLYVNAPTGASAGSHVIDLQSSYGGYYLEGVAPYNDFLEFNFMKWNKAATSQNPTVSADQGNNVRGIRYDNQTSLRFKYWNNTNAVQTSQRTYLITVLRKTLASL